MRPILIWPGRHCQNRLGRRLIPREVWWRVGVVFELLGRHQGSTVLLRAGTKLPGCRSEHASTVLLGRHQGSTVLLRAGTKLPQCCLGNIMEP
jgi:hypothetical protein